MFHNSERLAQRTPGQERWGGASPTPSFDERQGYGGGTAARRDG